MKVTITYCGEWNYLPKATSLAAALSEKLGVQPELIQGKNGVFDVVADDRLLFSKKTARRFPEDEEILGMLRKWAGVVSQLP